MQHKLRAALTLSLPDWADLLQAWLMLLAVDLGLRRLPFPRVHRFAASRRQRANNGDAAVAAREIRRLERLVGIAARNHVYPMTCLRQALMLQWLPARRAIFADLRIGVRRDAGALEAHAWVECAGQAVRSAEMVDGFTSLMAVEAK
jgi:hypothetical protein